VLQYSALLFVVGLVMVGLVVHRRLRGRAAPAAVNAVPAIAEA
jgi:hypothetical protein